MVEECLRDTNVVKGDIMVAIKFLQRTLREQWRLDEGAQGS